MSLLELFESLTGEKGIKYLQVFGIKVLPTPSPSLAPKRAKKVNTVAVIFNSL